MSKRLLLDLPSELEFPFATSLPIELWRKIATHLLNLSLLTEDLESLLNLMATSRAATDYLRPALCLIFMRIYRHHLSARAVEYLARLEDECKDGNLQLDDMAIEKFGSSALDESVSDLFLSLALNAFELEDQALRELVYVLYIGQLQERLLYLRDLRPCDPQVCFDDVSHETQIGDIFYSVWEAEELFGTWEDTDTEIGNPPKLNPGESPDEIFDSESDADDDERYDYSDDGANEEAWTQEEKDEFERAKSYTGSDGPVLPLLCLPGLRVTRLGPNGGEGRATNLRLKMQSILKAVAYRAVLPEVDVDLLSEEDKLKRRAFSYAMLAESGMKCARLYPPRRTSLLQDAVVKGVHLYFPHWRNSDSFRNESLFVHTGGPEFPLREKIRAIQFLRLKAVRDSQIYKRLKSYVKAHRCEYPLMS